MQTAEINFTNARIDRVIPLNMPVNMPRRGGDDLARLEKEAVMLSAGLAGGGVPATRATLAQLKMLSGMVGQFGTKSAAVKAMIGSAIAKAQRQLQELEDEEHRRGSIDSAEVKFDRIIYDMLSPRAKKFFDAIDEDKAYVIAPINKDGDVVATAAKKVKGSDLRKKLTFIKFQSLDTDSKKKILTDTFGAEEAEHEGTPLTKWALKKRKRELAKLHEALDDLEAYKALTISQKFPHDVADDLIERNHKAIALAHAQIDEVNAQYDAVLADMENGVAKAKLRASKLKMKKLLKEDVIEVVLLEQSSATPHISGGVSVANAESGLAAPNTGTGYSKHYNS